MDRFHMCTCLVHGLDVGTSRFRITGPSGRTEKDGVKYMVEGMKAMTSLASRCFQRVPDRQGLRYRGERIRLRR